MGRPLRMFVAEEAYFITQRCFQSRPLMTPTPAAVRAIGGVLAKATHRYRGIRLHDAIFMSNHFHLIITATDPAQIPRFMSWLSREISVRVGRLIGWRGSFFDRRYDAAAIVDDDALLTRLEYIRQHGVKEGLTHPGTPWPGLTLVPELLNGSTRTFDFDNGTTGEIESLSILVAPLPPWAHLSPRRQRELHRQLTNRARAEAHAERRGKPYLGARRVRAQAPQRRPGSTKRTPRVACFASTREGREAYRQRYRDFVEELRTSYGNLLRAWRELGQGVFCLPGFALAT